MSLESLTLIDSATGSYARVLPGFGFNCYEFVAQVWGREIDVLWSAPNFASGRERPSGSGIPILFPFPGRLPGTTFHWDGKEYQLQEGDGRGNAIHGFVLNRAWRVLEQTKSRVTAQFQASIDDPELTSRWPADFRLTATYQLHGNCLSSRFEILNPDEKPLPCGFGTHPYFRVPLGPGQAKACVVRVPVCKHWELIDMLPTGRCKSSPQSDGLRKGWLFGDSKFDDVFGGLESTGGRCRSEINDPVSGRCLELEFDSAFHACVVYTPPHREAICIEPYTCVPGALGMALESDTGLRVLAPRESMVVEVSMSIR